ncbi:type II secretion system protein [Desulfolutivibrio sulfoxidireducens]|uniref:type II secretion system protein n=1 Tax=Desulfolutivibrio sulfoxidireducens TaxID=2773299 RepID=UPI00159E74AC|nr:type II secretion system protein [Desulfolutivibrio sulfoxidireducens]
MRNRPLRRARGFTLIEIIITLVILGIAAAMVAVFFGPGVTRSSDPIFALQNDADLQAVMENMIVAQKTSYSSDLSGFSSTIGAEGSDQTNSYGTNGAATITYHVDRNSMCSLPSGSTTFTDDASGTFLCVTISHPTQSGSKLSYLFTTP